MISKLFTKPAEYTRTTSGTIFSANVWISGGQVIFQHKTWCIPLEAFASKTEITVFILNFVDYDALLTENGDITPKYLKTREILLEYIYKPQGQLLSSSLLPSKLHFLNPLFLLLHLEVVWKSKNFQFSRVFKLF